MPIFCVFCRMQTYFLWGLKNCLVLALPTPLKWERDFYCISLTLYFKGNFGFKSSLRLFADASTCWGFKGWRNGATQKSSSQCEQNTNSLKCSAFLGQLAAKCLMSACSSYVQDQELCPLHWNVENANFILNAQITAYDWWKAMLLLFFSSQRSKSHCSQTARVCMEKLKWQLSADTPSLKCAGVHGPKLAILLCMSNNESQ